MTTHSEPVWVVQSNLGSTKDIESLRSACQALDLPFVPVTAVPFSNELPALPTEPKTIFYGSANFITNVYRSQRWTPGVFFDEEQFTYAASLRQLGDNLLNADARVTTLGELAAEDLPTDQELFIRPDADLKEFAGGIQRFADFRSWVQRISGEGFAIGPSTKIAVSSMKTIEHEWRLFVVAGRVISGSHYRQRGRLAVLPDVPADVKDYGERMARLWSPAPVFVLDIAQWDSQLKVIEINGFNSSGFYESNVLEVVRAISDLPY